MHLRTRPKIGLQKYEKILIYARKKWIFSMKDESLASGEEENELANNKIVSPWRDATSL